MILEKEMQKRKIQRLLKSNNSLILKNKELIEENTILKQKISSLEKVISDIQESEQIYRDGIADIKELKEKYSQAIMSVNSMKKKYKKDKCLNYELPDEDTLRLIPTLFHETDPEYISFYIALYTGARCSEIFGLTWDDVDFDNHTIHIHATNTPIRGKNPYID